MSGEQLSASVEETNAMRAKLGLKPLGSTNSNATAANDVVVSQQQQQVDAVAKAAASRLAHARQQRMLSGGVHLNKTLAAKRGGGAADNDADDEDDSPQAFIARQRLATKRVQEQAARVQKAASSSAQYGSSDLAGVQVGHSADQFAAGETRILTLADTEVLDGNALNDAEDVLVDVHIAESERRQFLHNESKRKRYDVYEAADSVAGARPILDFYDERHAASGSIRLDDTGGMDLSRLEREAMIERQLEAKRSGRVLYELSALKDPVIASDTRAPEEIIAATFKKPRTKKKRSSKDRPATVSTADLIAEIQSSTAGAAVPGDARTDRGSRSARDHVADEDTADVAEAAAIARAKREAYEAARGKAKRAASARLGDPSGNDDGATADNAGDAAAAAAAAVDDDVVVKEDDDDNGDEQLYAALERARRSAATAPTDVAATILARQAKREADASSARSKGILYTDTTQFISTLDAQVDDDDDDGGAAVRVKAEERSIKAEELADNSEPRPDDMDMDVDDKPAVAAATTTADEEEASEDGVAGVMGPQPSVAIGVGIALAMLRSMGDKAKPDDIIVGRRTDERIKQRNDDNKPLDTGAPPAEVARRMAAMSNRRQSASERRQFNFELKYTDDEGRELTTKEAYRHLSYKFHGIAPSANKREKYAKQREEELAARQVAENVEETALKLERLQKKKKTAGIELKHL